MKNAVIVLDRESVPGRIYHVRSNDEGGSLLHEETILLTDIPKDAIEYHSRKTETISKKKACRIPRKNKSRQLTNGSLQTHTMVAIS